MQSNVNSYYKLQLLKHDKLNHHYVFRAWGRVGTTIGGTKLEDFDTDFHEAKAHFEALYLEKTGNRWKDRKNFVKCPNKFFPLDIDYGDDVSNHKLLDLSPKNA